MFRLFVVSLCYAIVSGQIIGTNISSSSQCQPSTCGTQLSCSTNSDCQCLALTSGSLGICAVSLLSCSSLTPCLNDNVTCTVPYTACVITPRCNKPMCYPLALANPQVCPSQNSTTTGTSTVSTTSGSTTSSQVSTTSPTASVSSTSTNSRTTTGGSTSTNSFTSTVSIPLVTKCAAATCRNYTPCSFSNSQCVCYALSQGNGICGISLSCSSLIPCNNKTLTCNDSQSVCIINSCCVQPVCFPLSATGNNICPTNYSSSTVSVSSSSTSTQITPVPTTIKSNTNFSCLSWNQVPTIVAGNGTSGNGITTLSYPFDLSIDSNFNLYINDYSNSRIIKFSNGSLVGKPLTNGAGSGLSQVYYPSGSWIDTYGNLYISDTINSRIMKYPNIALASQSPPIVGQVVVGAGYGCGYNQLSLAFDVAVDSLGNIFISDYWCNQVTKWTAQATSGTLAAGIGNGTAGNGTNGLSNPVGIYVDQNRALYIADYGNGRIQKWSYGSSTGVTIAGGNGQLFYPMDVSVDNYGTIYVLTLSGFYRFNSGSTSGTLVISAYGLSYSFKFDSIGNLYVADYLNSVIKKYTVNSTSCSNAKAIVPQVLSRAALTAPSNDLINIEAMAKEIRRKQLDRTTAQ